MWCVRGVERCFPNRLERVRFHMGSARAAPSQSNERSCNRSCSSARRATLPGAHGGTKPPVCRYPASSPPGTRSPTKRPALSSGPSAFELKPPLGDVVERIVHLRGPQARADGLANVRRLFHSRRRRRLCDRPGLGPAVLFNTHWWCSLEVERRAAASSNVREHGAALYEARHNRASALGGDG